MRWQNPWAWIGLLSVALPILVHLFSRRPARVEAFPSLRFLDVSRLLPTRRTRLTDHLLLLVRMAVVAVAVAALAQPLWRSGTSLASTSLARAMVIDTASWRGDRVVRSTLEQQLAGLEDDRATTVRIESAAPREALAGAVAWLEMQRGRAELIIVSDFPSGALDSLDLLSIPSDITVRLVRAPVPDTLARAAAASDAVVPLVRWAHTLTPARANIVRNAVRALGGTALTDASSADVAARVIVIASPGADSGHAWSASARPLSAPWMGDVVYALHRDTTLVSAAADLAVPDSALRGPEVVVVRAANQAPVVTAASIDGANGNARLLLTSRAPAEALVTAALLLSASRTSAVIAGGDTRDAAPTDERLRQWERLPAAAARVSSAVPSGSADSGPSDARFLWLGVLLLLGIETWIRRRAPLIPVPSTTAAVTDA
ncbi:MAG: BatA domain-containing protein [Gemmatimonadaceae bacterium]|nr:BatA domain-containing protein [Gemmatimonadaceae bacterium]